MRGELERRGVKYVFDFAGIGKWVCGDGMRGKPERWTVDEQQTGGFLQHTKPARALAKLRDDKLLLGAATSYSVPPSLPRHRCRFFRLGYTYTPPFGRSQVLSLQMWLTRFFPSSRDTESASIHREAS